MKKEHLKVKIKEEKPWYTKWWIEALFIIVILFIIGKLLNIDGNSGQTSNNEQKELQEKIDEYNSLQNQFYKEAQEIINIENKYLEYGMVEYTKLREEELIQYLELCNSRINLTRQLEAWFVNNAEQLKNKNLMIENVETDLQIQQEILNYRETREDTEERRSKLYQAMQWKELQKVINL